MLLWLNTRNHTDWHKADLHIRLSLKCCRCYHNTPSLVLCLTTVAVSHLTLLTHLHIENETLDLYLKTSIPQSTHHYRLPVPSPTSACVTTMRLQEPNQGF
ncbi:hypothetical protein L2E82_37294 [Cichorium intybus]|uniref:Uncharacterized protein n=1 Tax=Cichorium intybus TaxID=13427 RepID=A0ACB9AD86_CICIN|nr:hypothetical protein L2E82_37294 [Cichorium intybus]